VTTLPNPPPAPTRLAALAVSDTEIDLSWRGGSGDPTAFKIERKKENGSFKPLRALDPGVTTYNDTGLEANTLYTYRVRATNAGGDSDPSNEAAATTQAAVSGSLQAVRKVDFGQVRLHGVRTRSLTLRNTSRKNSMRVTVNTASSPFTVVSGSGSTLVAPGGSVALALRFSPTRRPRVTRTLVIETSDPANRRVSVSLTGTGR
jgi:hypothetical protein